MLIVSLQFLLMLQALASISYLSGQFWVGLYNEYRVATVFINLFRDNHGDRTVAGWTKCRISWHLQCVVGYTVDVYVKLYVLADVHKTLRCISYRFGTTVSVGPNWSNPDLMDTALTAPMALGFSHAGLTTRSSTCAIAAVALLVFVQKLLLTSSYVCVHWFWKDY